MNALSRAEERGSRGSTGAGSTKDERSAEQCSGESVWVSEITRELEVRGGSTVRAGIRIFMHICDLAIIWILSRENLDLFMDLVLRKNEIPHLKELKLGENALDFLNLLLLDKQYGIWIAKTILIQIRILGIQILSHKKSLYT